MKFCLEFAIFLMHSDADWIFETLTIVLNYETFGDFILFPLRVCEIVTNLYLDILIFALSCLKCIILDRWMISYKVAWTHILIDLLT